MPAQNGNVREHVVREMREEIRDLASEGLATREIDRTLNGRRTLTEAERGLIELLTYHALAEVNGRYWVNPEPIPHFDDEIDFLDEIFDARRESLRELYAVGV